MVYLGSVSTRVQEVGNTCQERRHTQKKVVIQGITPTVASFMLTLTAERPTI